MATGTSAMRLTPVETPRSEFHTGLVINGKVIQTKQSFPIYDPAAPQEIVGYAAAATPIHAAQAVEAAQAAWKGWSALDPERRAKILDSALDALAGEDKDRIELLVRENGKIRAEAEVELAVFNSRCKLAIGLAGELNKIKQFPSATTRPEPQLVEGTRPKLRVLPTPPFRSQVSVMPMGVVTIIIPYNWPLAILAASLPYALIAGNTVCVKPPPTTPLSVTRTLQLLAERLPPGVLNVVTGSNEAVSPLISHPYVRKIVFTGSTMAGKTIMKMAADNLTRVTLELGGNDPAILCDDVTLDPAALQRLVVGSFLTSGQVCMGVKRIYVHRSRYDELVEGMSQILHGYKVGHGLDPQSTMGPLNSARQRDFVKELCDDSRKSGTEVREFGTILNETNGFFLRPSLVLNPALDSRIVMEEQFGPALPIISYDDVNPLIDQLNEEWAGLCSSVWTKDPDRAASLASRLRTGTTWINNANAVAEDDRVPFGGFRQSGIGRELGLEGLLDFTEPHSITYPG
jgi:acyl-CoA reductase-like NAD-dependent aldehyde dehydrogenase